jgi:trehalose 6-phosphate synthase
MLRYDLLGFQTASDQGNFADYAERELGLRVIDGGFIAQTRTRLGAFPIGIDPRAFAEQATKAAARPEVARLRGSLQGGRLAIGVDRIDYSKGLPNRLRAVDRVFVMEPRLKRDLSVLQIAGPSRGQIEAYRQLQAELATLVGEINGRHGDVDWAPIRYVNKGFAQSTLAGLYRTAQIGLVTPLCDGMNLVAKEYVAAQNPLEPGVLILSEFAGAAKQLDAALLVNPHDIDALARAVTTALVMPAEERRERWQTMMATIEDTDIGAWYADFVSALEGSSPPIVGPEQPIAASARIPALGRTEVASIERR